MRYLLTTALSTLFACQLLAADRALIIANEDYANGPDIENGAMLLDAQFEIKAAGFTVTTVENAASTDLTDALVSFAKDTKGTGRIIIAVSGHFVSSQKSSWLLGVDADLPAFGGMIGVELDTLIEVAARAPGQAVVLLGTEERQFDLGPGLRSGISLDGVPQGVTVITGPTDDISEFTQHFLQETNSSLATSLQDWPTLKGTGFLAPLIPFIASDTALPVATVDPNSEERAFWTATKDIGTINAFRGYLLHYESGLFVKEANARIAEIEAEPALRAEAGEAALNLTRDTRREIQRALSLIGFDPKGIDGIFGRGSRAAISAFQKANGNEATGFLTRAQIEALSTQAEIRALELEREAQARKAELEQKDNAYWKATGALGDEAGLRAYLERYPDGVFAEIAIARLEPFESARRSLAQAEDRAAWDLAETAKTVQGYQDYLQAYPEGAFVEQARERLSELQRNEQNAAAMAAAARNEERLGLNTTARRLVEERLDKAGLKPGAVDGQFDDDTRRAIRRFQEARNITKTGFLNQATMVRLLAEAVFR